MDDKKAENVWTVHHIAHECPNSNLADISKDCYARMESVLIGDDVRACLSFRRYTELPDRRIFISLDLESFQGIVEVAVTFFRFDRGRPKRRMDVWKCKPELTSYLSPHYLPHEKMISEGWLTEDIKLRVLVTLHLQAKKKYSTGPRITRKDASDPVDQADVERASLC